MKDGLVLAAGAVAGLLIAWVDSRPAWDDVGITVMLILAASLAVGWLLSRRVWLGALAVGVWIPLIETTRDRNLGALFALVVALAGAYAGHVLRRLLPPLSSKA